ncbi:hypothetical protein [Phyllobacterium sp. UNC302MFCol5.2]|uniref:hypothetical protein n=1 Tax=Phyllobacterium sp. UNC302MFCol5.2 TaxID=1449065 RepID=UPI0004842D13|nr:hypothetical protein [Phyllobacterium sp. UNC302MFCol5.2]
MNWRLGFLRIWIASSVLWLLGTGLFFYNFVVDPKPYLGTHRYYANANGVQLLDYKNDLYYKVLEWADQGVMERKDLNGTGWSIELFGPASDDQATVDARLQTLAGHMEEEFAIRREQDRWKNLQSGMATALVPPIVFLIFGWGIAWIVGGFRTRTP